MLIRVPRPTNAQSWWDGIALSLERLLQSVLSGAKDYTDTATAVKSYTVATLPTASENEGLIVYVSDETGGATIAFSDGTAWRRAQDRTEVA